ncbi:MAG TPA: hypothetical protein PLB91_02990 [Spirochaetales bacterium]|nr:hypothetical protein [Spirochaetales bacterium]HRY54689.1 DNA-binding protein [Spirochaetia bacterium]HRZ63331.1 DNA-binding protein [Spirochaetia bacterium]
MRGFRLAALLAAAACLAAAPDAALAADLMSPNAVSSSQLVEEAKRLDGASISFEGEVIGEAMPRRDGAWINVSDGAYAIGVWLPASELGKVRRFGSYRWKGDRLRVVGSFNRACPEHGGDLDIHARSVEVLEPGSPIEHGVPRERIAAAALLLAAGSLSFLLWRKRSRNSDESRPARD